MIAAMPFNRLAADLLPSSQPEFMVGGLEMDSRKVREGDVFIAVPGLTTHGLQYAAEAIRRGCVAVLYPDDESAQQWLEQLVGCTVPLVPVTGLNEKLGPLASRFYGTGDMAMQVVGITGTNGKTSCAHFLAQSWSQAHGAAGFMGTLGNGLLTDLRSATHTTGDVISVHRELARCSELGAGLTAMEVSSHALDQGRVDNVPFDIGVFTNLTHDHLDYHADMQAYGEAKQRLFSQHRPAVAVINTDDAFGRQLADDMRAQMQVVSYGMDLRHRPDLHAQITAADNAGLHLTITTPQGSHHLTSSLLGAFNAQNLLAVWGCLAALGWQEQAICEALTSILPVPGRMNRLGGLDGMPLIVVDYAHTPDSLQQALSALRGHTHGRLCCVFGCGGDRDKDKRPQMGAIAAELADRIIVTNDNPRNESPSAIADDIVAGIPDSADIEVVLERAEAIRTAIESAAGNDVVLVAGKGHETYQQIGDRTLPFDDAEQVRAVLEARS